MLLSESTNVATTPLNEVPLTPARLLEVVIVKGPLPGDIVSVPLIVARLLSILVIVTVTG